MTRKTSAPQLVKRAEGIYRLWTEKDPDDSSIWSERTQEFSVDWDKLRLSRVGGGGDILYTSDKWEKPGVLERYHHPFDSGPSVYASLDEVGDGSVGAGDEGVHIGITRLLGISSLKGPVVLTLIAAVNELVIQQDHGPNVTWRFPREPPALCSTLDKKGLVILSQDRGPIFIRGGRMRVTARGIVG